MNQSSALILAVVLLVAGAFAVAAGMTLPLPYTFGELVVVAGLAGLLLGIALGVRHWRSTAGKTVVLVGLVCLVAIGVVYVTGDSGAHLPAVDPPRASSTQAPAE